MTDERSLRTDSDSLFFSLCDSLSFGQQDTAFASINNKILLNIYAL